MVDVSLLIDCEQSLRKSVERRLFLRKSCFLTQTNKMTEGGLGREHFSSQAFLGHLICLRDKTRLPQKRGQLD